MGMASISASYSRSSIGLEDSGSEPMDWVSMAACGSLIAGGLLLLGGKRRAALAAAAGTALMLVDEREALRTLWARLPGFLDDAQWFIGQVEEVVDDLTAKGESVRAILGREG